MKEHITSKHTQQEPFPCEFCGLVLANYPLLEQHVDKIHVPACVQCNYCELKAKTQEDLQNHVIEMHPEVVVLFTMAKQVDSFKDTVDGLDKFKSEVFTLLKTLIDNQNAIKQELFLVRNMHAQTAANVNTKLNEEVNLTYTRIQDINKNKTSESSDHKVPIEAQNNKEEKKITSDILYIGDSISANVHFNVLEEATEAKFVKAKIIYR